MVITREELLPLLADPEVCRAIHAYADVDLDQQSIHHRGKPKIGSSSAVPCKTTSSTAYTLVLTDNYTCVETTANVAVSVTIPPNSGVNFPVGSWVEVRQYGTGQITFVGGTGVTLRSSAGAVKTCQQYSTIVLHQRATNEWVLVGDLV